VGDRTTVSVVKATEWPAINDSVNVKGRLLAIIPVARRLVKGYGVNRRIALTDVEKNTINGT